MTANDGTMQDVTGATGRQVLDDIFEESRLLRAELGRDLAPADLAGMQLPADPYVAYHSGTIEVDGATHDDGETLVVASDRQKRRYLIKRWNQRSTFRAYQLTPEAGERLRLLNVYRIMTGQTVG